MAPTGIELCACPSDVAVGVPTVSDDVTVSARRSCFVSDTVDCRAVHGGTRWQPTVVTFGWRTKLALSSPPFFVLGFWAYAGVFNHGAAALGIGVPMLWASLWWIKQVWVKGPAGDPTAAHGPA